MELKIDIDQKELQVAITNIIARQIVSDYSGERRLMKNSVAEAVKEVIYSNKEQIIEMVVNRASAEIVRKAMPVLVKKMTE